MANPSDVFKNTKAYFHALSKVNTEITQYVFESKYKTGHTVRNEDIWADNVGYAETDTDADNFATANPTVVKKYTLQSLTEIPGSNGQGYYIDDGGEFIQSWISPTDIPEDTTKDPSLGYDAKLYESDNTFIPPTYGVFIIDYYAGIVLFEEGYTPADMGWGTPKITCYVYIGTKGTSGGGIDLEHGDITSEYTEVINLGITEDIATYSASQYRTFEYLISVTDGETGKFFSSKIVAQHDDVDVEYSHYSLLGTKTVSFNVVLSGGNVILQGTGLKNNQSVKCIVHAVNISIPSSSSTSYSSTSYSSTSSSSSTSYSSSSSSLSLSSSSSSLSFSSSSSSSSSSISFSSSSSSSSSSNGAVLWTPSEITTTAWYDADDTGTITESGGAVSQWDDKSGNGNNVTQGSGSSQPSYNTSDFNGKPSITFDGSPDKLVSTLTQLTTATIAVVIEPVTKGTSNNSAVMSAGAGFSGAGFLMTAQNYSTGAAAFGAFYQDKGVTNTIPGRRWNGDTTLPTVFEKGIGIVPCNNIDTDGQPYVIGMFQSGGGPQDAYVGKIAEIIIIPSVLSLVDQKKLEGYLAWKWGLEASLPIGHPYKSTPPYV